MSVSPPPNDLSQSTLSFPEIGSTESPLAPTLELVPEVGAPAPTPPPGAVQESNENTQNGDGRNALRRANAAIGLEAMNAALQNREEAALKKENTDVSR